MNVEKQLEVALETKHLVMVVFYADPSSHYEWIDPILRAHEKRIIELVKVNVDDNKSIVASHNIGTAPVFLLLHGKHELWRQVGELTVKDLKDVLDDFR